MDGNRTLIAQLAILFEAQAVPQLAELREACERGDGGRVSRLGHALKGSLAAICAHGSAAVAHEVEAAGARGDAAAARLLLARLGREVHGAQRELRALARGTTSADEGGR